MKYKELKLEVRADVDFDSIVKGLEPIESLLEPSTSIALTGIVDDDFVKELVKFLEKKLKLEFEEVDRKRRKSKKTNK